MTDREKKLEQALEKAKAVLKFYSNFYDPVEPIVFESHGETGEEHPFGFRAKEVLKEIRRHLKCE